MKSDYIDPRAIHAITAASTACGVSTELILGRGHHQNTCIARNIAAKLMRDHLHMSYPKIGRTLGRDHTTVLHGIRRLTYCAEKKHRAAAEKLAKAQLLMINPVLAGAP